MDLILNNFFYKKKFDLILKKIYHMLEIMILIKNINFDQ